MGGEGMGSHRRGAWGQHWGRGHVCAAQKAPEGDDRDRQTHKPSII